MLSIVLSSVATLISIVVAVIQYLQNKKINRITLRANLYSRIFDDYLIEKLPLARKYMRFDDNKLIGTEKLSNEFSNMIHDALFFKYDNKDFYIELKNKIIRLDDYITDMGNKKTEQEEQAEVWQYIQAEMEGIYKYINNARLKY